ncbi:hypothetical protein BDZ91DRAFT_762029 [Kalaharituber pfeilii]|nr:hypothetical protein BDZ91DRAFT_762029 [Kalaharituber pfeilii]
MLFFPPVTIETYPSPNNLSIPLDVLELHSHLSVSHFSFGSGGVIEGGGRKAGGISAKEGDLVACRHGAVRGVGWRRAHLKKNLCSFHRCCSAKRRIEENGGGLDDIACVMKDRPATSRKVQRECAERDKRAKSKCPSDSDFAVKQNVVIQGGNCNNRRGSMAMNKK